MDNTNVGKDFGLVDKNDSARLKGQHIDTLTIKMAPSGTQYTNENQKVSNSMFGHVWIEFQGQSIGWGLGDTKTTGGVENLTFRDSIGYDQAKTTSITFPLYSQSVVNNISNYISGLKMGDFGNFSPNYNLVSNNCISFVNSVISITHYDNDKHNIDFINELQGMSPNAIIEAINDYITEQQETETPLVIDLTGAGINTLANDGLICFDHNNDGVAESTGWIGANNAFLALDKNGDGKINNGNELFGNNTLLSSGGNASNGFEALKEHDINSDGVINELDNVWDSLLLWIDKNVNGATEQGELISLSSSGISEINLEYYQKNHKDSNGNNHWLEGSVSWDNGTTTVISDIVFNVNKINTVDIVWVNDVGVIE